MNFGPDEIACPSVVLYMEEAMLDKGISWEFLYIAFVLCKNWMNYYGVSWLSVRLWVSYAFEFQTTVVSLMNGGHGYLIWWQDLSDAVSAEEIARYLDLKKLDERVYMFEAVSAYDG